jgi:hypothetical protein
MDGEPVITENRIDGSPFMPLEHDELMRRISRDIADSYDEELEMEIEDRHPLPEASTPETSDSAKRC